MKLEILFLDLYLIIIVLVKGTFEEAFNEGSELYELLQFENDCLVQQYRYDMEMKHYKETKFKKMAEELPVTDFHKKFMTQRSKLER